MMINDHGIIRYFAGGGGFIHVLYKHEICLSLLSDEF